MFIQPDLVRPSKSPRPLNDIEPANQHVVELVTQKYRAEVLGERDGGNAERGGRLEYNGDPGVGPRIEIAGEDDRPIMIAKRRHEAIELLSVRVKRKREVDRMDIDDRERLRRPLEREPRDGRGFGNSQPRFHDELGAARGGQYARCSENADVGVLV